MKVLLNLSLLLAMTFLPAIATQASPQAARPAKSLPIGSWGGEHANLAVTRGGATLEFECATAEIPAPIALDADGRFHVRGSFQPQGPGPTRDTAPNRTNAEFSGHIEGNNLELQIKLDSETEAQTYTLVRGRQTRLRKCR
jgi:hypothetical protein